MKAKFLFKIIFYLSISILLSNCSDKDSNEAPQLHLISPLDGTEIIIGPLVTVKADAIDSDGTISEIRFFVDNQEKTIVQYPPYEMTLDTKNLSEGMHVLKVIAKDNQNKSTTIESQIELSLNFTPGQNFFDTRDGTIYTTVQIGDQCWMSQNLNFKTDEGSWAYDDNEKISEIYGRLYSMKTALKACPVGWHLPTDEEWKILESSVDSQYGVADQEWNKQGYRGFDVGLNLKATAYWIESGNGVDKYGFNAIPSGYKYNETSYDNLGFSAFYWTGTSANANTIPGDGYLMTREIFSPLNTCHRSFTNSFSLAIRCIKD